MNLETTKEVLKEGSTTERSLSSKEMSPEHEITNHMKNFYNR